VARFVELFRHTDNDGDVLTPDGIQAAIEAGRHLAGGYAVLVSSGAQRATQTLACMLAGLGEPAAGGVVVEADLRSEREDRWREIYAQTHRPELAAFREADPGFVADEAARLGAALRRVLDGLPEDGRALAVGHSPMNEAAVFGVTGETISPLGKGTGVVVMIEHGRYRVGPRLPSGS
jgi:broad specificity phosphatase PhoE